jgi:hypothetical protein
VIKHTHTHTRTQTRTLTGAKAQRYDRWSRPMRDSPSVRMYISRCVKKSMSSLDVKGMREPMAPDTVLRRNRDHHTHIETTTRLSRAPKAS